MSDEPRDKPPASPGSVPQFVWPPQISGAHLLAPPPAPEPPKKDGHLKEAATLIGVVVTIGTIIFSAGQLTEKLKGIEASQKVADEQQAHRTRLEDDRYDKLKSAVEVLGGKFDALSEQMKQQARGHRGRRRDAVRDVDDRP